MNGIVVLFSGGLDSAVLSAMAIDTGRPVTCLFIDWGQPACEEEHEAAQQWCRRYGGRFVRRRMELDSEPMRNGDAEATRYVPARNLAFVGLAANIASAEGADEIWYGATAADGAYPDCRPGWIGAMNEILAADGLRLRAPLIGHSKAKLVNMAADLGFRVQETFSCYEPFGCQPCGNCKACHERLEALKPLDW